MLQTISQPDFALRIISQHTMLLPTTQAPAELFFAQIKEQTPYSESPIQKVYHNVYTTQYLTQMKNENNILNIKLSLNFLGEVLEKNIRELGESRGQPVLQTSQRQPAIKGKAPQVVHPPHLPQVLQGASLLHKHQPENQIEGQKSPLSPHNPLAKKQLSVQQTIHRTKPVAAENKASSITNKAVVLSQQGHAPKDSQKLKSLQVSSWKTGIVDAFSYLALVQKTVAHHADLSAAKTVVFARRANRTQAPDKTKSLLLASKKAAEEHSFFSPSPAQESTLFHNRIFWQMFTEQANGNTKRDEQSRALANAFFNNYLPLAHLAMPWENSSVLLQQKPKSHTMLPAQMKNDLPMSNSSAGSAIRSGHKDKQLSLSGFPHPATPLMNQTQRGEEAGVFAKTKKNPPGADAPLAYKEHAGAPIEVANAAQLQKEIPADSEEQSTALGMPKSMRVQHSANPIQLQPAVWDREKSKHSPAAFDSHTPQPHVKQSDSIVLPQMSGRVNRIGSNNKLVLPPMGDIGNPLQARQSSSQSEQGIALLGPDKPVAYKQQPLLPKQHNASTSPIFLQQHKANLLGENKPNVGATAPATVVYRKEPPKEAPTAPPAAAFSEDIAFIKKTIQMPAQTTSTTKVNTAINASANAMPAQVAVPNLDQQVNAIADKVYNALERRLRSERMRKGLL